jgi:hypothetical protein
VVLAVVILQRLGWAPTGVFWAVVAAIVALVVVRTAVQYGATKRRLGVLEVRLEEGEIATQSGAHSYAVARDRVARIVEVEGALGGIRVESQPDPRSGVVVVASVPRGGDGYGEVRAAVAQWRAIERRGRRGPAVRLAIGVAVVAAIFFLPFVLEDFVARSKLLAAALVVGAWAAMRWTMRGR